MSLLALVCAVDDAHVEAYPELTLCSHSSKMCERRNTGLPANALRIHKVLWR